MMGGGGQQKYEYQAPRQGVDRRQYGELSSNGFQSRDEYDAFVKWKADYQKYLDTAKDGMSYGSADTTVGSSNTKVIKPPANPYGFKYDEKYKTYSLKNGVDVEAAMTDWQNYEAERIEIATYDAKEQRRKKAPDELQSSKTVDLSIGTTDDTKKDKEVPTITQSYDTSPSTASTQQPLGIY